MQLSTDKQTPPRISWWRKLHKEKSRFVNSTQKGFTSSGRRNQKPHAVTDAELTMIVLLYDNT